MATCSEKFSALLTDNGEVWTFGSSENGTLGHEEKTSYIISNPKMINDINPMIYITSGPESMMAIEASSKCLWAWGNNVILI
jgi:alpha-tubulin suppressor-like RCC1 family protein